MGWQHARVVHGSGVSHLAATHSRPPTALLPQVPQQQLTRPRQQRATGEETAKRKRGYTDHNAAWLKPAKRPAGVHSDDDSDDDNDDDDNDPEHSEGDDEQPTGSSSDAEEGSLDGSDIDEEHPHAAAAGARVSVPRARDVAHALCSAHYCCCC